MDVLLGLVCGWAALNALALGIALTDRPGAWGSYLASAGVVIGAAISGTILMLL